ncbi:hypothetical protein [Dokdonia sp. PRO95]|uniref:hypothetical protein n=1 Tax=Dokdonia sp. PRO95 TaxID=1239415 RepID=UPI00054E1C14|nr:hypothetical protein [Dokdonia sp. PRO95]
MDFKVFKDAEYAKDSIVSIVYRLIILIFSVFIVIKFNDKFIMWQLLIAFLSYTVFHLLFHSKNDGFQHIKLLVDYAFIGFILVNFKELNISLFTLLILPIINSKNYIDKSMALILYFAPLALILFIDKKIILEFLIILVVLFGINSLSKFRKSFKGFYDELNNSLDTFLLQENALDNMHEVYDEILPVLNKHNIFLKPINQIICFEIVDSRLNIINGSLFTYELEFESLKIFTELEKTILYDLNITVNDKISHNNLLFKTKSNTIEMYYLLTLSEEDGSNIFKSKDLFYKLISPFFVRLSHIFNFKRRQDLESRKNFDNIAKKVTYVNNAINSMHFTRNKIGPLKTYLDISNDYDMEQSNDRRLKIEPYLRHERNKLRTSLKLILDRADTILEKSNNPFNVLESNYYPFINILVRLRESVSFHLNSIHFEYEFIGKDKELNNKVKMNETGIDLVFSNWLSNISKYKLDNNYGVQIEQLDSKYIMTFHNNFIHSSQETEPSFVRDFNSDDRMAILKRNTHGLIEIKDFLDQMGLNGRLWSKNHILFFSIEFKKF